MHPALGQPLAKRVPQGHLQITHGHAAWASKWLHHAEACFRCDIPTDGQTTVPFFLVVICYLIKEPAEKHSNEPTKTIQHCNQWPDDCTFFSGRNLIEESAETIQAHGTPKHSNRQPDGCTFFSGRNLIDEGTRQKT